MPINSFLYPGAKVTTGYDVANSCRFNDGDSAYMNKTFGTPTNADIWTFSCWVKRSSLGTSYFDIFDAYTDSNNYAQISFHPDNYLFYYDYQGGAVKASLSTNGLFRDTSAWLNIVIATDTTQSTEANRIKLYVNGTQYTWDNATTYPDQNQDTYINKASTAHYIGTYSAGNYFDGYLAETVFIDGSQLAASSFGEFDEDSPRIWKPKNVSGLTFGTNGFYLDFEDSSNLGNDANGGTDWTENNLAATDQSTDTCTNNFATFNPLFVYTTLKPSYSDGNLTAIFDNSGNNEHAPSTIAVANGKWYGEFKWVSATGTGATVTGVFPVDADITSDLNAQSHCYLGTGQKRILNTSSSYGDSYTSGDIIGIALDMDNNKLYFSKNGTWQDSGDPTSGSTGTGAISITADKTYFMYCSDYASSGNRSADANFGSPETSVSSGNADANGYGNFEYSVPSGYYALCTKNLAEFG